MFERFSDRARRVLVLAQEEALLLNHNFIGTEHILIGLVREGDGMAAEALGSLGISLELLRVMPELGCPRFVAAGTCFEYALSGSRLSEATPLVPHDLYGGCKKSLFEVAQGFSALTGVSVATPRIFYSYGPYEDSRRLVPSIVNALLSGQPARATRGEQVRDYLNRAVDALSGLAEVYATAVKQENLQPDERYLAFLAVLESDARDSLATIQLVLAQNTISSQLIDNLNASIHLRSLLTDVFLIDEILKPQQLLAKPVITG